MNAKPIDPEITAKLVATRKWSTEYAQVAQRSGFRCEYCELNFLASVENYKLWTCDHLVPASKGGTNDLDNLVEACRICNVNFKGQWDPRNDAGKDASREKLIEVTRTYIAAAKAKFQVELDECRAIVSGPPANKKP